MRRLKRFASLSLYLILFTAGAILCSASLTANEITMPVVLDQQWQIELVVSEPELVTPVGCCFDQQGRLLVIESHTHFPPDNYDGPKVDRIYRFEDTNGDGVVDRKRLFYEGGTATMTIAALDDQWIAVASRSQLIRIRDGDDDGVAEQQEVLLTQQTNATYPHNGLTGLALGPDGRLYIGQGENLGEPYQLVAADESVQSGEGEGGNVFSCTIKGEDLKRVATGFWNPFGLCFDSAERLWAVGNDPDAMPPCRLIHVVPTADYGFQFRFGRAGTHPLQAWNGELPGTLPMAAATGEAPCAVLAHGKHLWVTSWGDNLIERFELAPDGASWTSRSEAVVVGTANFRPVDMAIAPDGSIYITDWVDRSYPVHGKGRLWRLSRKDSAPPIDESLPELSQSEQHARQIQDDPTIELQQRIDGLSSNDPFLRQAAIAGLVKSKQLDAVDRRQLKTPLSRVGMLSAWRWEELTNPDRLSAAEREDWIDWALADDSETVALFAVRWATERQITSRLPAIRELLQRDPMSPQLFSAVIASIAFLESGSAARGERDPEIERLLYEFAASPERSSDLRAMAIEMLPPAVGQPNDEELAEWIEQSPSRGFSIAAIGLLAARENKSAQDQLARLAANPTLDDQTRADAIAGLSRNAGVYAAVLNSLSLPRQPDIVRQEARRVLRRPWQDPSARRPADKDVDAWAKLVGDGGDRDAGRRVFLRGTCVQCHAHSGRGARTGPDLTGLASQMTRRRLLESILLPSKEVAPLYVPWRVLTIDGHVLTGLRLDGSGARERIRFQGADGLIFEVPIDQIQQQQPIDQSIMPLGLEDSMTLEELRDLAAFLVGNP